jgi:hypothetical protein
MSGTVLNIFYVAEPAVMIIALVAVWCTKERRRFPALLTYFVLRLTSFSVLACLLHVPLFAHVARTTFYSLYFYSYWSLYLAGAVAIFFVIQELFNYALEPLPGLKRLGSVAFRWVACLSFVAASASALTPRLPGFKFLVGMCDQLMRCESIFLLGLLLFLMLSAGKLGLSYRSRVFGISFGFGIMAASNLIATAFFLNFGTKNMYTSPLSIMDTGASLLTAVIWSAYFLQREPARQAVTLPVTSPLVRWNEVAIAINHPRGSMAMSAPGNDFFLQDVEKVVDRIMTKNSLKVAS